MSESLISLAFMVGAAAAVLWFIVPFVVFIIKDRLNELIELQKETNRLLLLQYEERKKDR